MQSETQLGMSLRGKSLIGAVAIACSGGVHAAAMTPEQEQTLRMQVIEQTNRLETLRQQMAEADAKLSEIKRVLGIDKLRNTRGGTATAEEGRVRDFSSFELAQAQPATSPTAQIPTVGQAPQSSSDGRPPAVAPIFDQPGVLTPRGKFVFEPGFQYSYSSSNRVSLVGYTIIPALTIGLIDVREVRRNTFTANLTGRWGITNRFEIEAKLPYVYRSDSVVNRPLGTPSSQDEAFSSDGSGLGDVEVTGRYQFNDGGQDKAYYIGSLRFKSRTGKDQFEVPTDLAANPNAGGLQRELPTGSGFYTIQPGLTFLYPTDPAVFFGGLSYQYNVKRSNIKANYIGGTAEQGNIGEVDPGDVIGFNFGMGLALNERSSFSIGYDHSSVGKSKQGGKYAIDAVRTELGTLLLGYSHKLNNKSSLNLSVGVGVTDDTPDVTMSLRMPTSF